jgi:hypothetical protein
MRTGSWFPALAATTNQSFGMHFGYVHVLAKLTLLASSFAAKISLSPQVGVRFWFGFTQESSICPCHLTTPFLSYSLCLWCNLLEVLIFSLYFTCNLMWYICVTFRPTKKKVMSSSCFMFPLLLCQSIVGFFYGFLGMFHIGFIHPRCLSWMVSFPLNQVLPLSPP